MQQENDLVQAVVQEEDCKDYPQRAAAALQAVVKGFDQGVEYLVARSPIDATPSAYQLLWPGLEVRHCFTSPARPVDCDTTSVLVGECQRLEKQWKHDQRYA